MAAFSRRSRETAANLTACAMSIVGGLSPTVALGTLGTWGVPKLAGSLTPENASALSAFKSAAGHLCAVSTEVHAPLFGTFDMDIALVTALLGTVGAGLWVGGKVFDCTRGVMAHVLRLPASSNG